MGLVTGLGSLLALVGMAIGGLGFGRYVAVDLALVADVLSARDYGKDLVRCSPSLAAARCAARAMMPVRQRR